MQFRRASVYVAIVFFMVGTIYGLTAYRNQLPPYVMYRLLTGVDSTSPQKPGRWQFSVERGSDTHWQTRLDPAKKPGNERAFQGLGYLKGYEGAGALAGTVTHDRTRSHPGLNLFVSGHAPEALLIDMEGDVLHRWKIPWSKAFPDVDDRIAASTDRDEYLRKFHVFPDGEIIVNFEWLGLVKLNRNSEVLWSTFNWAHHDLWVDPDGRIHVLTAKLEPVTVRGRTRRRLVDYVTVLDPDGTKLREFSLYDAIKDSDYASILKYTDPRKRKLLHTNSLELFTEDHPELGPAFSKGNALISMRNTNTVAVIDPEAKKVVWSLAGPFEGQHDPVLLENENLLIFDNWGHNGFSKVIEMNPRTQSIEWAYYGNKSNDFASKCCGTNQRLPNGNTLITDSSHGRAFEVTPEGTTVWEFYNPYRTGENDQLVAALYALKRYPRDFFGDWLRTGD